MTPNELAAIRKRASGWSARTTEAPKPYPCPTIKALEGDQ